MILKPFCWRCGLIQRLSAPGGHSYPTVCHQLWLCKERVDRYVGEGDFSCVTIARTLASGTIIKPTHRLIAITPELEHHYHVVLKGSSHLFEIIWAVTCSPLKG